MEVPSGHNKGLDENLRRRVQAASRRRQELLERLRGPKQLSDKERAGIRDELAALDLQVGRAEAERRRLRQS